MIKCKFKYEIEIYDPITQKWVIENRYYFKKIELLKDISYRKNMRFIIELDTGI